MGSFEDSTQLFHRNNISPQILLALFPDSVALFGEGKNMPDRSTTGRPNTATEN